ncbi:MAG: M20/M25/M40 family metallo-hydrolase [Acidobacteriia bacterium]|nr:M20/M25/M40 family metallo-hydrolase [Terriglobia bacterium]
MTQAAFDYYQAHRESFLEGLKTFLRIPSISTLPEHKPDIQRAAEFVAGELRESGMKQVEIIAGTGNQNPLVYAEWLEAPGKPTLLIYGHYDVQPPDPLEEWVTPPFEPAVRNDNIYARGAVDDKGQVYLLLKAVEGFMKTEGKLPINVKLLLEGEEETGGENIEAYVAAHPDRLQADAALVCDTEMFAPELPTITTGLRGLIYTELEARGASHDLHSGMYGGAAPNPFQALVEIINGLKGPDGKIRIPGFYNRVKKPTRKELESWKNLPFNEKKFMRDEVGAKALVGEKGIPVLERLWARPTLEVHGLRGGFTGEGAKTTVRILASAPATVVSTESRWIAAAAEAMEQVFHKKTVYMRSGGSIPIVGLFQKHISIPSVMMGFGLPDDQLHAPNEKFHLPNFYRGIEAVARYFALLAK